MPDNGSEATVARVRQERYELLKSIMLKPKRVSNPYVTWADVYKTHGRKLYVLMAREMKNDPYKRGEETVILKGEVERVLSMWRYKELLASALWKCGVFERC